MKKHREAVLVIESDKMTLAVMDFKCSDNFIYESSKGYSGYQEGEFLDELDLRNTIKFLVNQAEKDLSTKINKMLIGIPGEFTYATVGTLENSFSRVKKVKSINVKRLLERASPLDALGYTVINAAPIDFVLDGTKSTLKPESYSARKIKVVGSYVLCKNKIFDLFERISSTLGFEFRYTSIPLAEALYILPNTLRDKGAWLIDVGFISTSICYAKGDGITSMMSFSLGGGYIAADIMQVMGIPYEISKKLLQKLNLNIDASLLDFYFLTHGNKNYKYEIQKINEVATDRIFDIARNIKRAMLKLSGNDTSKDVNGITYLTGSGISHIAGAKEILASVLGGSVVIVSPNFQMYNKPSDSALASFFALEKSRVCQRKLISKKISGIITKILGGRHDK